MVERNNKVFGLDTVDIRMENPQRTSKRAESRIETTLSRRNLRIDELNRDLAGSGARKICEPRLAVPSCRSRAYDQLNT